MTLTDKLRATVRRFDMFPSPGIGVVVGVSGGADSVALLLSLLELRECAPDVFVCHFNHCLRGDESLRDENFVRELCEKNGLPFEVRRANTRAFSKKKGLSTEHAAREMRYAFLREVCRRNGARRIATAHTLDDRAETVLMRMVRGSGSRGISSIMPVSGNLVRPFLGISRKDVLQYLRSKDQSWVEDSSNKSPVFMRNRVRNELIPLLETFNPRVKNALNRLADVAAGDYIHIHTAAKAGFEKVFPHRIGDGFLAGTVSLYQSLQPALRFETLRVAYEELNGGLERLEFSHLEQMDGLLMSRRVSGAVKLPGTLLIEKGYDSFYLGSAACRTGNYGATLKQEGVWKISGSLPGAFEVCVEKTSDTSLWGKKEAAHFSLEKTGFPIEVRNFRPGDRTVPLGMNGTKKLKAVFTDEKLPRFLRAHIPVFTCRGKIIWAGGVVVSESFKAVKGETNLRLRLRSPLLEILNGGPASD